MSNETFDLEALIAQELARQQAEEMIAHLSKGEGQLPQLMPKLDAPTAQKRYVNFAVETLLSQPSLRNFLSKEDLKLFLSYLKTGSPTAGEIAAKIDDISERINILSPHLHVMDLLSIENMPKTPAHKGQQAAAQSTNNTSQRTRPNKRKKQISDPASIAQAAANALFGSDLESEPKPETAVQAAPTQQREQAQAQAQIKTSASQTDQTPEQQPSTLSRTRKPPLSAAEQTALAQQRLYDLAFPERQQQQTSVPITTLSASAAKAQPEGGKSPLKQAQPPIKAQAKAIAPPATVPAPMAHQAHASSVRLDGKTQSAIKVLQGKKTARPASTAFMSKAKTESQHQASGNTQQPTPVSKPHVVRRVLSYQPPAEGLELEKHRSSRSELSRELTQLKAQNALFGHQNNLRRKENNRSQNTDIPVRSESKEGLGAIAKNGIKVISGSKPRAKNK